ncbi:MAG: manganese efflux pump MntP family protein [Coriobacteriales bacterium]|nr:manganese efflux pump MntP family protein [Coriobacteriales bacterium]
MGVVELFLIAVGLSMDAFSVSVCKGLGMRRLNGKVAFVLAFLFGAFQGLMPVLGWFLGSQLLWLIAPIDHWIAFGLLAFIGGNMVREALSGDEEDSGTTDHIAWGEFLMLAVATSIDALAVGISFAALAVNIATSCLLIGVTTFVLSLVGVFVGHLFGARYERPAQVTGGIVLICIGLKTLAEHLGFAPWL